MSSPNRRAYEHSEASSRHTNHYHTSNQQHSTQYFSSQTEMRSTSNVGTRQVSSRQQISSQNIQQVDGANLEWSAMQSLVYNNGAGMDDLFKHKNILLDLVQEFGNGDRVIIEGRQKDEFNQRLLLLEHEIEGLNRRKIMFSAPDHEGGTRSLDYTALLNEKQNQVVELEKKIQNLEERMRRMQSREVELENEIIYLNNEVKRKNEIIHEKERSLSSEVAFSKEMASIIDKINRSNQSRSILSDLVIPSLSINDIKSSASRVSEGRNQNVEAIKLIREFEKGGQRINSESIIEGWIMGLPRDSPLRQKFSEGERRVNQDRRYTDMQDKFTLAGDIYRQQIEKIRRANPNVRIDADDQIFSVLKGSNSSVTRVGDVVHVERLVEKTVEVPVQDARTKHLIHLLATNYKKLFTKYPKLYDEMDSRLSEFFSQELIDVMEVDEIDRVVSVVKYVPQVVKVENVYAYSSEKSRKVEFHLRVLIKALLEEMEKMKARSGIVPEIDEGVIGMIRKEIMDVVDVDDILKVYRVTPKIVEVEKVVEKIVEKVIEVPKIVEVEKRIETPYEVKKYEVVENTVNVPVQVPKFETLVVEKLVEVPRIQEKIVEVPRIVEKAVQVVKEVPKIVEVERLVEKIVQVDRFREIEKEIVVPMTEYRDIELVRQKVVPTQRIVEKSIPVDQIIEKIVEVKVEVPKVVEVEKIVEKIVERVEYVPAPDVKNHVEIRYEPVDKIIEKIVPIVQTIEKIVEVPQIIEKIVELHDVIEKPIEVEVIRDNILYRDRIKEIERVVEKPVVEYRTIEKEVEKIVQVPLIKEIIKVEKEIVEKPVVEVIERLVHKEVEIEKPKIIYQDRIKEVDRIVNHFIKEPEVVHIFQEKIVPVEKVVERIRNVPTTVEKIIEKMVEVPKVVEVEKVVEKVVVVPRVIEKVVNVPQIVEKIVEKIEVVTQVVEVEKLVQVPVITERAIEVEVPRNIYVEVEKPVDVVREVLVRDEIFKENTKVQEMISERVVVQTQEVPRTLEVEKIVTNIVQQPKIIEVNRDIIVPVEIEIPVDKIVEKMVPIHNVHREVEQVDKIMEKIVAVRTEDTQVVEVERRVDNVIVEERIKQVERIVPYMQDRIVEVEKLREKVVPVERVIQEIREVQQVVEKVVDRVSEVPRVYEVEKLVQKRVDVPKIIEVERVVPEIIRVNQYIERIAEKIVEIPILMQQLKEIQVEKEVVVQVNTENTNVVQVDRNIQKEVIVERLKEVTNNIHLVEQTLQLVDRIVDRQMDPVMLTQERVMEVPQVIEKIVEKIVVMPQIVEVLKYVHEIAEKETLGLAVGAEVGIEERRYKDLGSSLKSQLTVILNELRTRRNDPSIRVQIELIEKFLAEFEQFLLFPRIQQIVQKQEVEKVVEKDRPVLVPFQSESHLRQELSKTILIEKLINELKEVRRKHPDYKYSLDDDISLIFLSELGSGSRHVNEGYNKQLDEFSHSVQRKFSEMGGWTTDHQMMLNSFLQERFLMANVVKNSNETIKKTQAISEKRLAELRKTKEERDSMAASLKSLKEMLPSIISMTQKDKSSSSMTSQLTQMMDNLNALLVGEFFKGEPTRKLDELVMDVRVKSMIREKDELIIELKDRLRQLSLSGGRTGNLQHDQAYYESRIRELSMKLSRLESNYGQASSENNRLKEEIEGLRLKSRDVSDQQLREELNRLNVKYRDVSEQNSSLQNSNSRYSQEIERLKIRIRELEEEINRYRVTSPKQSINTKNSITTPPHESRSDRRGEISRRSDKSESESESYGVNYINYGNAEDERSQGEEKIYRSSYQVFNNSGQTIQRNGGQQTIRNGNTSTTSYGQDGRHLMSGSDVGGQIASQHYMLGTESRSRGEIEGSSYKRMQQSSISNSSNTNGGTTSTKRYETYYESKYDSRQNR